MKKLIIIVSLSLILILAGVLYGKILRPDEGEIVKTDHYGYMNQFPDQMPNIDPMPCPELLPRF